MADETTRWRVNWHDRVAGKDGCDIVDAPTEGHAIWEVASGYKDYIVADMDFVSVELVEGG